MQKQLQMLNRLIHFVEHHTDIFSEWIQIGLQFYLQFVHQAESLCKDLQHFMTPESGPFSEIQVKSKMLSGPVLMPLFTSIVTYHIDMPVIFKLQCDFSE